MGNTSRRRSSGSGDDPYKAYAGSLNRLLAGVRPEASCGQSANPLDHEWYVLTTYLQDASLGVFCVRCGCDGVVTKPSRAEWRAAYDAPSNPYRFGRPDAVRYISNRLDHWRQEAAHLAGE